LNDPIPIQYGAYLLGLLQGDWGESIRSREPVVSALAKRFVPTATLAVIGMLLSITVGVTAGVLAATRRGSIFDDASMLVATVSLCVPTFSLGILLQYGVGVRLQWLPTAGLGTWQHYILPALAVSTFSMANIARLTRAGILEILTLDYIRTARAKGLSERAVFFRHALRNAWLPIVTMVALAFGRNLVGSVVTETVFAIPGLGRLLIQSISNRDYPIVQGLTLLIALSYALINLLADLLYAYLDPRVTYE